MTKYKRIRSCAIWYALEILGDKPTLLILESYWLGVRRFSDFQKHTGLLKTVVSDRLRKLKNTGCLKRHLYCQKPERYEYRGCKKLTDLYPLALSMLYWEQKWGRSNNTVKPVLLHKACGQLTSPKPVCRHCRKDVDPVDVEWVQGPGSVMVSALYSRRRRQGLHKTAGKTPTILFEEIADIFGDRWSVLIIRSIFTRFNSFKQIRDDMQIASNILSDRLKYLCESGILMKVCKNDRRYEVRYFLTEKGLDTYPVLLALLQWGDTWYAGPSGPPIVLTHSPCRSPLVQTMACSACGEDVRASDISFTLAGMSGRFGAQM